MAAAEVVAPASLAQSVSTRPAAPTHATGRAVVNWMLAAVNAARSNPAVGLNAVPLDNPATKATAANQPVQAMNVAMTGVAACAGMPHVVPVLPASTGNAALFHATASAAMNFSHAIRGSAAAQVVLNSSVALTIAGVRAANARPTLSASVASVVQIRVELFAAIHCSTKSATTENVQRRIVLVGNAATMGRAGCVACVRPGKPVWMASAATIPVQAHVAAGDRLVLPVNAVSGIVWPRVISAEAMAVEAPAVSVPPGRFASRETAARPLAATRAAH